MFDINKIVYQFGLLRKKININFFDKKDKISSQVSCFYRYKYIKIVQGGPLEMEGIPYEKF